MIQAIDFRLVSFRFSVLVLLDFSMNPFLKVPIRYWFISCMGALWFAMGAFDYVIISYKIPAYMQTMPEDLHYWFDQRPVWITGVWAINVWSALLGSFFITDAAQAGAAPLCSGAGRLYYCGALDLFV